MDCLYQEIIMDVAQQQDIDPRWIAALIAQESAFNANAVRYEPLFKYFFKPGSFQSSLISIHTEVATQKMSWGLGQIMGALAREQGLQGLMPSLLDPGTNIMHIGIYLKRLKKISPDPNDIFSMYNSGPGSRFKLSDGKYKNQNYVDSVNKKLLEF